MDAQKKALKKDFSAALEPFKIMLTLKRATLSPREWLSAVNRLRESALNKPEQYLGPSLPSTKVTQEIIEMIFDEFLSETKARADPKENQKQVSTS